MVEVEPDVLPKQLDKVVGDLRTVYDIPKQKVLDKVLFKLFLGTKELDKALSAVYNELLRSMVHHKHIVVTIGVLVLSLVSNVLNKVQIVV